MKGRSERRAAPEYMIWSTMIQRCCNPKNQKHYMYGARGIKVCDRWRLYDNFLLDMGRRPSRQYSIDRKNNDGDYMPDNCRWASRKEQQNNTRSNHLIEYGGVKLTISQWAEKLGLKQNTLLYRIRRGWSLDRALQPAKTVIRTQLILLNDGVIKL